MISKNEYADLAALKRVLDYILRSGIVGGYAVDPFCAYRQMAAVKNLFYKSGGSVLQHFFISFTHAEAYRLSTDDILSLGFEIGKAFRDFQLAYAVHLDASHIHLHCVLNTVSFVDGHKYAEGRVGFFRIKSLLDLHFPNSENRLYWSDPRSSINTYTYSQDDCFLEIN